MQNLIYIKQPTDKKVLFRQTFLNLKPQIRQISLGFFNNLSCMFKGVLFLSLYGHSEAYMSFCFYRA